MTQDIETEADIKRAVDDWLQYKMNAGKLYYDRLNSGSFIEVRGKTRRRIQGCIAGTADFFVLMKTVIPAFPTHIGVKSVRVIFLEIKSEKGRLRTEQKCFKTLVEAQGSEYYVVRSVEEIAEILR